MSFPVLRDRRQPEVHASTILLFKNRLLCAWFGGTKEGHADTKIWLAVKPAGSDDGDSWSPPRIVCDAAGVAHWNPVLFKPDGGDRILLFYKTGSPISSWSTQVKESVDGGETWSGARELVQGDKGID
jgi:predicted neuraminidase